MGLVGTLGLLFIFLVVFMVGTMGFWTEFLPFGVGLGLLGYSLLFQHLNQPEKCGAAQAQFLFANDPPVCGGQAAIAQSLEGHFRCEGVRRQKIGGRID